MSTKVEVRGGGVSTEAVKVQTSELAQLKQDAIDKIIFHATPKDWLKRAGPWML